MKTPYWVLVVIATGFVLFSLGYWFGLPKMGSVRNFIINPSASSSPQVATSSNSLSEGDYVALVSQTPKQAKLQFKVEVAEQDLNPNNIEICSVSVSAGSAGEESCYEATPDLIRISYDRNNRTLTLDDVSPEFSSSSMIGAFRGCAACTYLVKFSSLRTDDGKTLPNKEVEVY